VTLGIHWFRNDLRLRDNTALAELSRAVDTLLPVFVLDDRLLSSSRTGAPRVRFLLGCLEALARDLRSRGHALVVRRGDPARVVPELVASTGASVLSFNRDTTPYARRRDRAVRDAVEARGARVIACKDRVIFEAGEVRTRAGRSFAVYSPYRRAWHRRLREDPPVVAPEPALPRAVLGVGSQGIPSAEVLGFGGDATRIPPPGELAAHARLDGFLRAGLRSYAEARDLPALDGTSRLSPYLRFGAISVRACLEAALDAAAADPTLGTGAGKWIDELVWREFYAAILEAEPRVLVESHRPQYDRLPWRRDPAWFEAWCRGRTGYPIVDAGMRQLLETGWMHNRVRMLAASFLTKDLLIDWRLGERWFLKRLVDGDPASNNGGWQWSASTGTDSVPYFRIFNPVTQARRCDPDGAYVRRFLPELRDLPAPLVHEPWKDPARARGYPAPIVDHGARRAVALQRYAAVARAAG